MKKIRIILGIMLVSGLMLSSQVQGQAFVDHDDTWFYGGLESHKQLTLITPSGNMTLQLQFQYPEGTLGLPAEGEEETGEWSGWIDMYGTYQWFEGEYTLTSEGKLKFTLVHKKKWEV